MEIKSVKYIILSLVLLLVGLDVVMSATSSCDGLTQDDCVSDSKCTWLYATSCYGSQLNFCGLKSCESNSTTCVQDPTDSSVFYPIPSTTCLPSGYTKVGSGKCVCPNPTPSTVACASLDAAVNLTNHVLDSNDCLFYKTACFITFGFNCDNSTFAICRNKDNNRCVTPGLCALEPGSQLIYKFETQCVPNGWEIISSSRCACSS